jgi:leucine efflux protein
MFAPLPMLGITDVGQLVAATVVFLMLPGPGTFCILSCTARNGLRGGLASVTGVMMADAMLMFLAAAGVAALLQANPAAFRAMQYAGAAYLVWLGLKLLLARGDVAAAVPFSSAADFRRGFLVTIINPKAIVFYMAFFPLFIDPAAHRGSVTFLTMAAIITTCTFCYGSMLVFIGNAAAARLRQHRRLARLGNQLAGVFLIGFGIKLTTN